MWKNELSLKLRSFMGVLFAKLEQKFYQMLR